MSGFDPRPYLIQIKGKDYLPVSARLIWFRDVYPNGGITTELLETTPLVIVKATILDEDGAILAMAHACASLDANKVMWEGKAIEKAETSALGRALAFAGFGTQFSPDEPM